MAKVALLIGVSEYEPGLNPLPGAVKDIEAMQRVLAHPGLGGFDQVKILPNPEPQTLQESIEILFSERSKDDLALLFFSGHGIKDERGKLYFATPKTRKNAKGELVKATAVPSSFVQDIMSNSRCRRQVIILDCCFSGAFAEGMTAKDDDSVDLQTQLGGEGRVVLTSSTSTQYSFEQQNSDLSVYTRYIVEGVETGAADRDQNGVISIDELHEYARQKVQESAPAMKPKIYAVEEGFKIHLAQAPTNNPELTYRREVEAGLHQGEISPIQRYSLDALRQELGLSAKVADAIETEVLQPYRERRQKLQQYEQVLIQAIEREKTLSSATQKDLKQLQKILGLRNEDIAPISDRLLQSQSATRTVSNRPTAMMPKPNKRLILSNSMLTAIVSGAIITGAVLFGLSNHFSSGPNSPSTTASTPANSTPTSSATLYREGQNQYWQGDSQAAIDAFTKAIQINQNWGPENTDSEYYGLFSAYLARGNAYYYAGRYEEAKADFQQAAQLKPDASGIHYALGLTFSRLGDVRQAFESYNQAIQLDADWFADNPKVSYFGKASAYYNRAYARALLNDMQGAVEDYQQAADFFLKKGRPDFAEHAQNQIKSLQ